MTSSKLQFVRSHFNHPWSGVVLVRKKRKGIGDLLAVLLLRDRHGNRVHNRIIKVLDEAWTTPIAPIDISDVNPSWLDTSNLPKGIQETLDYVPLGGYRR